MRNVPRNPGDCRQPREGLGTGGDLHQHVAHEQGQHQQAGRHLQHGAEGLRIEGVGRREIGAGAFARPAEQQGGEGLADKLGGAENEQGSEADIDRLAPPRGEDDPGGDALQDRVGRLVDEVAQHRVVLQQVGVPVGCYRDERQGGHGHPVEPDPVAPGHAIGDGQHRAEEEGEAGGIGQLQVPVERQRELGGDVGHAEQVGRGKARRGPVRPVGHPDQEEGQREKRRDEEIDGENEARASHVKPSIPKGGDPSPGADKNRLTTCIQVGARCRNRAGGQPLKAGGVSG